MQWGAAARLQGFWDARAACNFIGGGTGSGLLVWAALGLFAGLPYLPAGLAGLFFVAAGLFIVWLEIGKPWRALNLFFRPQTSWMTREGIVALPLMAAAAVAVLFALRVPLGLELPSPVIPAAIAGTLALAFLYCQIQIMHSAKGLPAWSEGRIVPLLGLSGLTEGFGVYLVIVCYFGELPTVLTVVCATLIIARAIAWAAYLSGLTGSDAPDSTITTLKAMSPGFVAIGHAVPAVLITLGFIAPGMALPLTALAGIMATLGGWYLKLNLITKAGYIPKFAIPLTPVRGRTR